MKKNKKKIILISLIILGVLLILSLFILNKNKKELILSCVWGPQTTEYFSADRKVEVYEKNNQILYRDIVKIIKLTTDEDINNAIDVLFKLETSDSTALKYTTYEYNDATTNIILDVNLSELSKDEIKKLLQLNDISISGIQAYLEERDLVCERL